MAFVNTFAFYLHLFAIDPVQLSLRAGVRYLTVWNATHGRPIRADHAAKLRIAVATITGIPYTGTLFTLQEPRIEEQPTRPLTAYPTGSGLKKESDLK